MHIDAAESAATALAAMRAAALHRRALVSATDREDRDVARHELLVGSGLLDGVGALACYVAMESEPAVFPWAHLASGRDIVVPRVDGDELSFHRVRGPRDLERGAFGIDEPVGADPVPLRSVDAVLVPLVLFDPRCHRAGRGRGYYDRALRTARSSVGRVQPPTMIGVADDEDEVPAVPQHARDEPLDVVVTPTRVLRCSPS